MKRGMLVLAATLCAALGAAPAARADALFTVTVIGGAGSAGYDVNESGQVVGQLYSGMADTGFFYDGSTVVGSIYHDEGDQAISYANGGVTQLPFTGNSAANDINDQGQVVGWTDTAEGALAYLYSAGSMVLLNSLIDPASGWSIVRAVGINEAHQIAGRACQGGLCYAVRLDLAAAVPKPGTAVLFGAGLLLLALGRVAGSSAPWRASAVDRTHATLAVA